MFTCEETSKYLDFQGVLHIFDHPHSFDQLWFIVKNKHASKNIDDVVTASNVWKASKMYGCIYDETVTKQLQIYNTNTKVPACSINELLSSTVCTSPKVE